MTATATATAIPRRVLKELTPSEAEFQRRVTRLAEQHGWLWQHTRDSRRGPAGWPDLQLLRIADGRLIWAELKVWPHLGLRPSQDTLLGIARQNPHLEIYVWRWVWPGSVEQEIAAVLGR